MGKTRDVFKKIGDIKGTFYARMSMIKDRNFKNLTELEEIKKRQQEYTEELYKRGLNDLDNHDGVVIHLELDVLECEVKWALGSITTNKASGDDRNPAELFKIPPDDTVKVLQSVCQQSWKTQQWPVQFSSVAQSCPTLCDSMDHSTPDLPVHHQHLGFIQTHLH